jgi:glycosyltransferase involved in cell wall biosynthesis
VLILILIYCKLKTDSKSDKTYPEQITKMDLDFPRVLIFGQPFNSFSGGGITLTNLFKGWPKDKIAVTYIGHGLVSVTTDICDTYYQLGVKEHKWRFPFNLIQKKFDSGLKSFDKNPEMQFGLNKKGLRFIIVNKFFYPVLEWFGLYHCASKIELSDDFKRWLSEFKPEILYIQVATRETLLFARDLTDYLSIPSAIHNMDDWPSTISRKGLLKTFWTKTIDLEFRDLLDRMDLFLSISNAMSVEYKNRYGKEFKAFHNPIDISEFSGHEKSVTEKGKSFRILYIGRIGLANRNSVYSFAKAVSGIGKGMAEFTFDIYTPDLNSTDTKRIKNLRKVRIMPSVRHEDVPSLLGNYDLLLLPLDFNETGLKYAQYSIPTKASEYMISGTPILVFAPEKTAISRFCAENECGYCLTTREEGGIVRGIEFLIQNKDYRKEISSNAMRLARELFDDKSVRPKFQKLLTDLYLHKGNT